MTKTWRPFLMLPVLMSGTALWAQDKPAPINKHIAAWYYPGAESPGHSDIETGRIHKVLFTTKDDLQKVEGFYRKKTDHPLGDVPRKDEPPFGVHTTLGTPKEGKQTWTIWADDSKTRTDGEPRGVKIRTLAYDTPDSFVTIAMSRVKGEELTHVILVYLKKSR